MPFNSSGYDVSQPLAQAVLEMVREGGGLTQAQFDVGGKPAAINSAGQVVDASGSPVSGGDIASITTAVNSGTSLQKLRLESAGSRGNASRSITYGKFAEAGTWRTGLARVLAGTGSAKILLEGDSTWAGGGASVTATGYRPTGSGATLPAALSARGVAADAYNNAFGRGSNSSGASGTMSEWDSRLVSTGSVIAQVGPSCGGHGAYINSGGTLTLTAQSSFDTVDAYYAVFSGGGTFQLSVSGSNIGAATNTAGAPDAVGKLTVTAPAGSTITVTCTSGAVAFIGFDCYTSGRASVRTINGGWGGSKAGDWIGVTPLYGHAGIANRLQPDLIVANFGINEWVTAVPAQTFANNLATWASQRAAICDIAFVTQWPSNNPAAASQLEYRDCVLGVASKYGAPVFDIRQSVGHWYGLSAAGLTADANHPNLAGYQLKDGLLADGLLAASL